jgi:hypothetical protein
LVLDGAFKTLYDASGSVQDLYARAGTGANVMFRKDTPGDILLIAKSALNHCPTIFDVSRLKYTIQFILVKHRRSQDLQRGVVLSKIPDFHCQFKKNSGERNFTVNFKDFFQRVFVRSPRPPCLRPMLN